MTNTKIIIGSIVAGAFIGGLQYFVSIPLADTNNVIDGTTKTRLALTTGVLFAIVVAGINIYHTSK